MKMITLCVFVLFSWSLTETALLAQSTMRSMTLEDVVMLKSVSDPQISPDGRRIVYVVGEADL
ncbi:MAG: hypothetical protein WEB62_08005, partial [Bacteroidota bacterium]